MIRGQVERMALAQRPDQFVCSDRFVDTTLQGDYRLQHQPIAYNVSRLAEVTNLLQ